MLLPFTSYALLCKKRSDGGSGGKVLSELIKIELNVYFKSVIAGDESAALKRCSMNFLCVESNMYSREVRQRQSQGAIKSAMEMCHHLTFFHLLSFQII
jgi:hypothetical protein